MNSQLPPAIYRERVKVRLKWFNQTKGFGFVQIEDEDKDAFLHATLVGADQVSLLQPGTTLLCDLARGPRGLIAATVYEIDPSTADPAESSQRRHEGGDRGDRHDGGDRGGRRDGGDRGGRRDGGDRGDRGGRQGSSNRSEPHEEYTGPTETVVGVVKFYNSGKGYGFLQSDSGGPDIFLPGRVMQAAGLGYVEADARLRVEVRDGPKGRQAESVEVSN